MERTACNEIPYSWCARSVTDNPNSVDCPECRAQMGMAGAYRPPVNPSHSLVHDRGDLWKTGNQIGDRYSG